MRQGIAPETVEDRLCLGIVTGHERNDHRPVPLALGHGRVVSRRAGLAECDAIEGGAGLRADRNEVPLLPAVVGGADIVIELLPAAVVGEDGTACVRDLLREGAPGGGITAGGAIASTNRI